MNERPQRRATLTALGASFAVLALWTLASPVPAPRSLHLAVWLWVATVVAVLAVVAVRRRSVPWTLIASGVALFAVGDAAEAVRGAAEDQLLVALATMTTLLAYPLLIWGVALLAGVRRRTRVLETTLDAAITATAVWMVTFQLVSAAVDLDFAPAGSLTWFALVAYPPLDAVLVYLAVMAVRHRSSFASALLAATTAVWLATDLAGVADLPIRPSLVDAAALAAYLLLVCAALCDTSEEASLNETSGVRPALHNWSKGSPAVLSTAPVQESPARLTWIAATLSIGPLLLLASDNGDDAALMVGTLGVVALVTLRLWVTSAARRRAELEALGASTTDPVTGVLTRRGLHEHLADHHGSTVAAIAVHVEHLRAIRAAAGQTAADEVLCVVAELLAAATKGDDAVARTADTEFMVVCIAHRDPDAVASRLAADLAAAELAAAGTAVRLTACLGVHEAVVTRATVEDIITAASIAAQRSRMSGSATPTRFEPQFRTEAHRTWLMENRLRTALELGQLEMLYQPVVNAATGELVAVEALVRWRDDHLGRVPPSVFVGVAESANLAGELGEYTLSTACEALSAWQDQGWAGAHVHVNVTASEVSSVGYSNKVLTTLDAAGVTASQVTLEITESGFVADSPVVAANLQRLAAAGVGVAIDDFGTGYSSLSYLPRIPATILKIDRSFISGAVNGSKDLEVVRATIALAKTLGLDTIAEGVETPEQFTLLTELGCTHIQGYLFAEPLDAADVTGAASGFELPVSE